VAAHNQTATKSVLAASRLGETTNEMANVAARAAGAIQLAAGRGRVEGGKKEEEQEQERSL
jgi:hypothetical protein